MKGRTTPLTLAVVGAAVAVTMVIEPARNATREEEYAAIVVLTTLALIAELLSYLLPKGALASIASIPALAAVFVSPSWETVAAIAILKAILESARRVEFEKAVFNISQYALSIGLAALVYTSMGGQPFIEVRNDALTALTMLNGLPALFAFVTTHVVNSVLVSSAIALSNRAKLSSIWRANNLVIIGIDIVASPLVFLFAWAYVRFGAIAASALWIPIIGIRQVHKTNLELEQTNVELLDLMVKSIEARDVYTSGHSRRVQHYSVLIARAMALSEREVQMIGRAALLHDVGKIHEKYGPILRKADRLTPEEWKTMREHTVDGAELIATMTRLRELVGSVRHHHENWDGTGYPDGVAGELIPLPARIIRFADTIDAMTTERPYRPALQPDEVRAEIVKHRGSQFDPRIVDQLLSSAIWHSMLAPQSARELARFGEFAVVHGDGKKVARAHSA